MNKEPIFRQLGKIGIISVCSTVVCYSLIVYHFIALTEQLNWNNLIAILVVYTINKFNKHSLGTQADRLIEKHKL